MNSISNVLTLSKKELKVTFTSPLVYILTGGFSLVIGWLFYNHILFSKDLYSATLTQSVLGPIFGNMNFIFLFLAPLLTMKSFSEEKKFGTLDLLLMSTISKRQIILGKFIANVATAIFMLLFSLIFPLVLSFSGYNDWGVVVSSYIGIILSIMAYISVGMFASSLTDNQIIAAFSAFAMLFVIILLALSSNASSNYFVGHFFGYLSIPTHAQAFARGAINSYGVVYFISFIAFFLHLILKVLDSRNW